MHNLVSLFAFYIRIGDAIRILHEANDFIELVHRQSPENAMRLRRGRLIELEKKLEHLNWPPNKLNFPELQMKSND